MGRKSASWLLVAAVAAVAALSVAVARAAGPEVLVAGDKHGLAMARSQVHGNKPSQLLLYHSGGILNSAAVQVIYWGPSWGSSTYQGDKVTGLKSFYDTIGGSAYLGTNTEYSGTNGQVGTGVSNGTAASDTSSTPGKDPGTSGVLAEVAKVITNPVANGYYPVYTDIKRGTAGYCAWHSWGTIGTTPVQFAFFFDLDGDPGCDPSGTLSGLNGHSQGLTALANVSGHELSEAFTDPRGAGWYDRQGAENADKCAWTFNGNESFGGGSSTWYIQGNWSNNAYNANTGYVRGCINGN